MWIIPIFLIFLYFSNILCQQTFSVKKIGMDHFLNKQVMDCDENEQSASRDSPCFPQTTVYVNVMASAGAHQPNPGTSLHTHLVFVFLRLWRLFAHVVASVRHTAQLPLSYIIIPVDMLLDHLL